MINLKRLLPAREDAAVLLSLAFVAGFLGARALLSIATLLLGLNALRGVPWRQGLRNRWWWVGVLWVGLYAVSGFWSDNMSEWGERVQVKLPFLIFPLAMGFPLHLNRRQHSFLITGVCALLLGGIAFSLYHFFPNAAQIARDYERSFTFRTPAYNNHICFSAFLAATVFWVVALWGHLTRFARFFVAMAAALIIGYLHVLAAKTGLVMLYGSGLLLMARQLYRGRLRAFALLATAVASVLLAAWAFSPTLRGRIGYLRWSFMEYSSGKVAGNYSDPARLYSYRVAAWQIARAPLAGYGAGDVVSAMNKGYEALLPEVAPENRLVPHNQFLASGVAAGLPAMAFLLLWWALIPVQAMRKAPARFYNVGIWALVSVLLFVDPAFEVQFGIAVFFFFLYWFRSLIPQRALSSASS